MDKKELEAAAEAILFTMGNAVEVERIAKAIGMSTEATRKMLRAMKEKYETEVKNVSFGTFFYNSVGEKIIEM